LLRFARNDVAFTEYDSAISRRDAPEVLKNHTPRSKRAQGMPGARCTRGLVCKTVQKRTRAYRYRRGHPDIPCAMALRLIPCSPRRRIRLVTVADGLKDCLNPVGSTRLHQLDTSNGCQDHTASPYAASPVVCTLCSLTDKARPANTTTRPTLPRPPQPVPTFVTMANAPLSGTGWGRCRGDLGVASSETSEKQKFCRCVAGHEN
jgi:hypothetical protein